ncbi:hypothetical protein NZK35_06545 [Stieleria sp. ICT_E10.1]|uniref:hypothetical protein n=1 Tax=Stieleria sedimenti TaxID=2976331 RepID=UPI00217FADA8|nr:hypothetical protein [Stieleria sedimenti]MCS7466333.1 hypothetical protein [Stieleria sedimenti]
MNRIIPTIGLLVVGFALTTTSASAQHYGYGHGQHGHHAHYDQGFYHGGHSHHNDFHGGYHPTDFLTYPVHPPTNVYTVPVYREQVYLDAPESDFYCPNSGYCPQAAYGIGQQYAPVPSHSQLNNYAIGPTQGLNDPAHDGHDHSGHDHAGHTHSNLGNAYASPSQPQDRSYVPAPSLDQSPQFQPAPQQQPNSYSGIRPNSPNSSPSLPERSEAPVQMDGPPPQI